MKEYQKINTIYKRDMADKKKLLVGEWSTREFEFLQYNEWEFTEKVDGTNIRVYLAEGTIMFGGRTDKAQIPPLLLASLQETFNSDFLARVDTTQPVTLYGEGYGPKIQSGEKYGDTPRFVLFDVKIGDWWLESDSVRNFAATLDIPVVPMLGSGTLHDAVWMVSHPEKYLKSEWGDFIPEGIVARPVVQLFDRKGERIITKIKVRDFR
jgi:hypothetical protein